MWLEIETMSEKIRKMYERKRALCPDFENIFLEVGKEFVCKGLMFSLILHTFFMYGSHVGR